MGRANKEDGRVFLGQRGRVAVRVGATNPQGRRPGLGGLPGATRTSRSGASFTWLSRIWQGNASVTGHRAADA